MTLVVTRLAVIACLLGALHAPLRAAGSYGISSGQKPQVVGTDVEYLGVRVDALKDAVASVRFSCEHIAS